MIAHKHKILIYNGMGAGEDSLIQTHFTLQNLLGNKYIIEKVSARNLIENEWESETVMLVIPGGADIPYVRSLKGKGNAKIIQYVKNGGNYLGICAGSYFAGNRVVFAEGSKIEVIGDRELAFFPGLVEGPVLAAYDYTNNSGARAVRVTLNEKVSPLVYYNGGGYFVNASAYEAVQVIANYDQSEKAAIIKCTVGKGTALLSGVHFEFSPHLLDLHDPYLKEIIPKMQNEDAARNEFVKFLLNFLKF